MTRLFLAAGVAALAIAAPAAAQHGGGHGGGQHQAQRGGNGGGQHAQRGGGGGQRMQAQRQGGGQRMQMQRAQRMERQAPRMQRMQQREAMRPMRIERQQRQQARQVQNRGFERQQMRANRMQQANRIDRQHNRGIQQARQIERQQMRANRMQQVQNRQFDRQQLRAQAQNNRFDRQQMRANLRQQQAFAQQQFRGHRFAQGGKFRDNEARFVRSAQQAYWRDVNQTRFARLNYNRDYQLWSPTVANRFIGVPVGALAGFTTLNALPASVSYLYPDTNDYYYRYGDGYLYQVNRSDNLIANLLPLLAGGYMPGQYLPQPYMASYVPNYYGFNSFYPNYGNDCTRYVNGVIYEVDCYTGMVEDVIPVYANGYGVGQILPASYAYYNVPYQYRTMYYDTPDYNYWYAPGAIYQYDPGSSMITSVAALLSPGFSVGQALPMGYDAYNVPYAYRATYYDTPNAWYRYNNGYIYQVDPTTRLVTAIVASLLT